jgi:hypothetical protein
MQFAFGPHGEGSQGLMGSFWTISTHCMKGFPVNLAGQKQETVLAITLHSAPVPHTLGQGLIHLLLTHDKSLGQSVLVVHSGRQLGAFPKYPDKH